MRFFGCAVLFCLGLLLAIPTGLTTLTVGIIIEPTARELVAALGIAGMETVLSDLWDDGIAGVDAAAIFVALWGLSAALLVVPPAFIALIGEIAGLRSFVWYGFGTGALTAALPWLGSGSDPSLESAALGAEAHITMLLFLTGAAAGLTYWLVAGRSAGREPSPH